LCVGCGETAILELTMNLPAVASTEQRRFVFVQARSGTAEPFGNLWSDESSVGAIPLTASARTDAVSIVADADQLTAKLQLKLRFCRGETCSQVLDSDAGRTEMWFVVDRAFYDGERTELTITIPPLPQPCSLLTCVSEMPTPIGKCDVRGCTEQTAAPFCTGDRHPCD
jgi:hypothetical protein